jgi:hypothetical protein
MKFRRRLAAVFLAGAATAATIGMASAPAQASSFLEMKIWNSSHCLDNATEDNLKLQMWRCTGVSEQRWSLSFDSQTGTYSFTNQRTRWCIQAPGVEGTIFMNPCDPTLTTQQWTIVVVGAESPGGSYTVWRNKFSGLCLTTPSVGDGTPPRAAVCDTSDQYDRWHQ